MLGRCARSTLSPLRPRAGCRRLSSRPISRGELAVVLPRSRSKRSSRVVDEVHLVDREHDVPDAEQRHEVAVAPRLRQHALARVDQDHGAVGGRGAGDHVARVLLVPGRVGDDELAPVGREEAVGDVDRDALLALGREAVEQQREVELAALRADLLRVGLERRELVLEQHLRLVQQPADQRALAVVDAAAGDEAQQALALVRLQVGEDVLGDAGRRRGAIRSSPPASSSPSSRSSRGRSRGPGAPRSASSSISWMMAGQRVGRRSRSRRSAGSSRACGSAPSCIIGCSPGLSGMRSSSTMISVPSRSTTGRSCAK